MNEPVAAETPSLPYPAGRWEDAALITAPPEGVRFNDFCLFENDCGRWHAIGIYQDARVANDFFHAVGETLEAPLAMRPRIAHGTTDSRHVRMWAPFAVRKDEQTLLFYAHLVVDEGGYVETTMRLLVSEGDLSEWRPHALPGRRDNILFEEHFARDPQIIWDEGRRSYILYYVVGDGWSDPEAANVVRARTSFDLLTWSDPVTILGCPPGYRAAESIFVLSRQGLYYMWVCGFDYGRMALYVSDDPFDFGDAAANLVTEQSGHAPEIVRVGGEDRIACVAVASRFGCPPGHHDLPGIRVQPLAWRAMSEAEAARIHRKATRS